MSGDYRESIDELRGSRAMADVVARIAQASGVDLAEVGAHMRIENAPWMRLSVENIGPYLISVCHYGKLNGDLMRDPEIVFWTRHVAHLGWVPVTFQNDYIGVYRETMTLESGDPTDIDQAELGDQAEFCEMWASNIREQGFIQAAEKARVAR